MTKQVCVVAIVIAIGVWQHHFVLQAASADVYIFGLLIGAGAFGIYQAIHGTHRLADEFTALQAMKEIYGDAIWAERAPQDLLAAQIKRTQRDVIVYKQPSALATAHSLIVEEIQRNGTFRIPTATMQVLVADLESKLDDRQGMSHYLGALMVLLGLLGTFIGLMHTLESVGGILGSMDLSGNGGSGAIAGLIESLKRPLDGMSTGFGASLFGLIGSLIIGFLSKVDSKASYRLKHQFETWISTTVQIENMRAASAAAVQDGAGDPSGADGGARSPAEMRSLLKSARLALTTIDRLARQVEALTVAVASDREGRDRLVRAGEGVRDATHRMMTLQAAMETRLLENAQGLVNVQRSIHVATERLEIAVTDQGRSAAGLQTMMLEETRLLRESVSSGLIRFAAPPAEPAVPVEAIERAVSRGFAAAKGSHEEIAAATAELDHLIAMSHLGPRDIHGLKRLAALAAEELGTSDGAARPGPAPTQERLAI